MVTWPLSPLLFLTNVLKLCLVESTNLCSACQQVCCLGTSRCVTVQGCTQGMFRWSDPANPIAHVVCLMCSASCCGCCSQAAHTRRKSLTSCSSLSCLLFLYTNTTQHQTHAGAYNSHWGGLFCSSSTPTPLKLDTCRCIQQPLGWVLSLFFYTNTTLNQTHAGPYSS